MKLLFTFESALDLIVHLNEKNCYGRYFPKILKKISRSYGKKWKFSECSEKYFPKVRKIIFRKFGKVDDIPLTHFRHDPTPIYTWIPPKKPQVHPTFKNHINIEYEISSDPYLKHRALNLQDLSTKLSGRYSCRVSSIFQDDFKSRDLIIYCEKKNQVFLKHFKN